MNTELYIENQYIELDESVQFAITKQFEDITNPTIIINDWSKTVEIPFTAHNNKVFGNIYNPDMVTANDGTDTSYKRMGIYFNPNKKLDFVLLYNNIVLMSGYAKLNEVKQVSGKGTYNITLFGELGKVFSEMKKITFDKSTEDTDYLIDGSEYVNEYINKELIYRSWTNTGQPSSNINTYNPINIIGFAPNNSFDEGFEYNTYQISATGSSTFEDILDSLEPSFETTTGVKPSTIIKDGLLPRQIGEYRSYLQLPFIYFNKLFQIFQAKAEDITGYDFELDKSWFNKHNPYWYDLVYMLKRKFNTTNKDENTQIALDIVSNDWTYSGNNDYNTNYDTAQEKQFELNNSRLIKLQIYATAASSLPYYYFPLDNCLILTFTLTTGVTKKVVIYCVDSTEQAVLDEVSGADVAVSVERTVSSHTWDIDCYTAWGEVGINKVNFVWLNKMPIRVDTTGFIGTTARLKFLQYGTSDFVRSNSKIILNDLWNNEYNLFTEILNYCKMYRILISVDNINKKIKFTHFSTYFSDYTIEDWSDKVDYSQDFTIIPCTFENKYVLFNYEDSEVDLNKTYKEKNGFNYGELNLITDYNFNNDTKELFDGVKTSIVNTDTTLSWDNLFENYKIIYSFPNEITVSNKDKDNKNVDLFGSYYFRNGVQAFSTDLQLRVGTISDDTDFQTNNNTFFYSQDFEGIDCSSYPLLDVIKDNKLCLFNIPKENYTYITDSYNNATDIYTAYWKQFVDERYDSLNKIVKCHIYITPNDFITFRFNKFIKIDNQLYIVNKISNYDISQYQPTEVELVSVRSINNYIISNDIVAIPSILNIESDSDTAVTKIYSNSAWSVTDDNTLPQGLTYTINGDTITFSSEQIADEQYDDIYIEITNTNNNKIKVFINIIFPE